MLNYEKLIRNGYCNSKLESLTEIHNTLIDDWLKVTMIDSDTAFTLSQIHAIALYKYYEYQVQDLKGQLGKQHTWVLSEKDIDALEVAEKAINSFTRRYGSCNILTMNRYMESLRRRLTRRYLMNQQE